MRTHKSKGSPAQLCGFLGRGKSGYHIYAVVLREHPDIVKVGMTTSWPRRRREYDDWNFASGDGIHEYMVYAITEEFIDLRSVELACHARLGAKRYRKIEWFKCSLDEAREAIEAVLSESGYSWTEL